MKNKNEAILNYICESPDEKYGGFKREVVEAAKWAKAEIAALEAENKRLRESEALFFQGVFSKTIDLMAKELAFIHDCCPATVYGREDCAGKSYDCGIDFANCWWEYFMEQARSEQEEG